MTEQDELIDRDGRSVSTVVFMRLADVPVCGRGVIPRREE
jgi:hypothetical protein